MANPEISVVIPVRNGLPWIVDQLEALCGQNFEGSWELLVSDNGSSDGTQEVVRSYVGRLPLQIVDSHDQPGIGPARNAGARAASGPLLAFCDADDVVAPGWLNAIAQGLRDADAVGGHLEEDLLMPPRWSPGVRQPRPASCQCLSASCRPPTAATAVCGRESSNPWEDLMNRGESVPPKKQIFIGGRSSQATP